MEIYIHLLDLTRNSCEGPEGVWGGGVTQKPTQVSLKPGSYEQTLTPVSFSVKCECSGAITAEAFVPQGGKTLIDWEIPSLKCSSGRKAIIKSHDVQPPCFSPPLEFGVGRHTVTYTYGYLRGTKVVKLQCSIEIDIIGV
jgi:hypothetical protein